MEMIAIFSEKKAPISLEKFCNRFIVRQAKVLNWVGAWGMGGNGGRVLGQWSVEALSI